MAATSYMESAEEDLTCPLCMEYFVDPHTPKELNCPHVYCYQCLVQLVGSENQNITCPECRQVTRLPKKTRKSKGSVASLKTQLRLRSLAEKHMAHSETCSSLDPENRLPVPTCLKHKGEKMLFYCVTCKEVVCQICLLSDHERSEHVIKGVKVAYQDRLNAIKEIVERCEKQVDKWQRKARASLQQEEDILSANTATELKIDEAVTMAIDKAIEQGQLLKAELKQKYEEQLSICQTQAREQNETASAVKDTLSDAQSVMDRSSCYELLLEHDKLLEKLQIEEDALRQSEEELEVRPKVKSKRFTMVPDVDVKLGKLEAVRQLKLISMTDSMTDLLFGLASHDSSGILVVGTKENSNVRIYDKQDNGQYRMKFSFPLRDEVKGDNPGCDVAIARNGQYLVARKRYVELYDTQGEFVSTVYTRQDKDTTDVVLTSIATTEDGKIIVGDRRRSVITVHTPEGGELTKTIKTSIPPLRVESINNAYIVISDKTTSPIKVCVVDLDAEKETLTTDIKQKQCSVCYDEESDCLLICKWNGTEYINEQYSLATGCLVSPSVC